ncbi:hypothetical protein JB92DRAFT_2967794 [Gautieria morchelliformis]|nr:hypothetical protein JB92DRAFT_2967794 [Gautieria morchelliformis]
MSQPPQTENDAPETMPLRVDVEADFDAKVLQSLQSQALVNRTNIGPPTDIDTFVAESILLNVLVKAHVVMLDDLERVLCSWDDSGKDLDIIRQCVATSKFQPALEWAGLVEHDFGPVVRQLMAANRLEEANCERTGKYTPGLPERKYRPSGGESLQDLVHRGISELRDIVLRHAVALPAPPEEMNESDYRPRGTVDKLVKGVPHVVIVSHNIFLAELWKALASWKEENHVDTYNDYRNAGWYVCSFSFVVSA